MRSTLMGTVSAAVLAFGGLAATGVSAQDDDTEFELEEVLVTGSYIKKKSAADSSAPINVMDQSDISSLGGNTVADITRTLTINNGAENNPDSFTQNLTAGTENINIRGLGVASTLVMVNGKRQVNYPGVTDGGVTFVDTASLMPGIAVGGLEVLENGGATLYGSDAVGGVANFKTRLGFEGIEASVEYRDGKAGQSDKVYQTMVGYDGDRFRGIMAVSYMDRSNMATRDRNLRPDSAAGFPDYLSISNLTSLPGNFYPITLNPLAGTPNPLLGGDIDTRSTISIVEFAFLTDPTGATSQFLLDNGLGLYADPFCGAHVGTTADIVSVSDDFLNTQLPDSLAAFRQEQPTCGYDFQLPFDLVPDHERKQAYAEFEFDIADNHTLYGSFTYSDNVTVRNDSNFPIPFPLTLVNIDAATGAFIAGATPDPTDTFADWEFQYPFFPDALTAAGAPLAAWLGRSLGSGQMSDFTTTSPNPSTTKAETRRFMIGMKGEMENGWTYDLDFITGKSEGSFQSQDGLTARFEAALLGLGGPDCVGPLPGVNGCQFLNVRGDGFLPDTGAVEIFSMPSWVPGFGGMQIPVPVHNSAELLEWLHAPIRYDNESKLTVADAVFAGEMWDTDNGPIQAAIGFQYRKESRMSDANQFLNDFAFNFANGTNDYDGTLSSYGGFIELAIPASENLDLQTAIRFEDYGGNVGSTIDPTVSVLYRPSDEVSMRASYATAFRAPSVFQLFGSQTSVKSVFQSGFIPLTSSGSEDLAPEESTNWNFGTTWNATDGLIFNVDLWRIGYKNVIVRESPDALAQRFYASGGTETGGGAITPDGGGGIRAITTQYFNAAFVKTNGVDFGAVWTDAEGEFTFGVEATYVNSYKIADQGESFQAAGRRNLLNFATSVPEWRGNAHFGWTKGVSSLNIYARYVGSYMDDENSTFGSLSNGLPDYASVTNEVKVGSMTTVDIQYSVDLAETVGNETARLEIGAVNVFDKRPPFVHTDGSYDSKTHDPRGRQLYARVTVGF